MVQLHDVLNARSERTVPKLCTGAEVLDDDERFTVRKQPPGWGQGGNRGEPFQPGGRAPTDAGHLSGTCWPGP